MQSRDPVRRLVRWLFSIPEGAAGALVGGRLSILAGVAQPLLGNLVRLAGVRWLAGVAEEISPTVVQFHLWASAFWTSPYVSMCCLPFWWAYLFSVCGECVSALACLIAPRAAFSRCLRLALANVQLLQIDAVQSMLMVNECRFPPFLIRFAASSGEAVDPATMSSLRRAMTPAQVAVSNLLGQLPTFVRMYLLGRQHPGEAQDRTRVFSFFHAMFIGEAVFPQLMMVLGMHVGRALRDKCGYDLADSGTAYNMGQLFSWAGFYLWRFFRLNLVPRYLLSHNMDVLVQRVEIPIWDDGFSSMHRVLAAFSDEERVLLREQLTQIMNDQHVTGVRVGTLNGRPIRRREAGRIKVALDRFERMTQRRQNALRGTLTPGVAGSDLGPCAICLENYRPHTSVSALPCAHRFHPACIERWLFRTSSGGAKCPLCTKPLTPPTPYRTWIVERVVTLLAQCSMFFSLPKCDGVFLDALSLVLWRYLRDGALPLEPP
eukprot:TRINITY_DN39316_c0_g1_i1.p1 TRINITY_DN39316_c0_g1~~TRINITY_DN39316_c0_g1_i1.p1  ORF type:complete len:508 (+),score=111.42 TRINITY_DN39316_c0_g1_i1:59-1525(+)